ncbi:beta-hexosaminidase-like [Saccostrea echinata]|uniref:beta-hexosaminidase-like n=1 Tax=Saccostrea echinata TaxID=191078 RepID=UPI002A7EABBA|nr:beta-hexosaminidase-like [Saccostrea echinata]
MPTLKRYIMCFTLRLNRHKKLVLFAIVALTVILIHRYMQSDHYLIEEFSFSLPPSQKSGPHNEVHNQGHARITQKMKHVSEEESQRYVDYMAENFIINFTVIRNTASYALKKISLHNVGQLKIPYFVWSIYFYDITFVGNSRFPYPMGLRLDNAELLIFHEGGNLYRLQPTNKFPPTIHPDDRIEVEYDAYGPHVSRYFSFPNWFVSCPTCAPRILKCTQGESLDFVEKLSKVPQLKRFENDLHKPFTVNDRFKRNSATGNLRKLPMNSVIPTPLKVEGGDGDSLLVTTGDWVINAQDFKEEAKLLAESLQLDMKKTEAVSTVITFSRTKINLPTDSKLSLSEAYEILIDPDSDTIQIKANSEPGAFYAVQTLFSLMEKEQDKKTRSVGYRFPKIKITDAPRFEYRGLMLDVSRNFVTKKDILKLLDLMAMYKINKFHFHLTDDDGWRFEVPQFPELTKFAANRCHDPSRKVCLPPSLGSGPYTNTSGSGYYSVQDYKEILRYAKSRHIQVIPEVDVPGHAGSAVKAMELRYKKTKDAKYRLTDPDDLSKYRSAQAHTDNAVNPCIDSTYEFFKVILLNLHDMHKDIQPLTYYMLGGDEVAKGAWERSPVCEKFKRDKGLMGYHDLKKYFFKRLVNELKLKGLNVGLWEDAVLNDNQEPHPVEESKKGKLYTYSWTNIWEWKKGSLAYKLANAGYKVVMSPATYFYLDHPYEPDPEERGLYWATRYIDTQTVFSYQPDDLYRNRGTQHNGAPMTDDILCSGGCPPLKEPQNIKGIQADLWTETIRNVDQMEYMLFPRLLALAERAWHKAPWENIKDLTRRNLKQQTDWEVFANKVGHKELRRLEEKRVKYRLDLPGGRFSNSILEVNTIFPGTPTEYSLDGGKTWKKYDPEISTKLQHKGSILLRSSSFDGKRKSRVVSVD